MSALRKMVDLNPDGDLVEIDDSGEVTERRFSLHDFAFLELRAARAYLERRIAIARVKEQHGLLTEEEQDDLILEVAELKADLELWKAYR